MTIKQAVSRLSQHLSGQHWFHNIKKEGKVLVVYAYNVYQAKYNTPEEFEGYKIIIKEAKY